ncbi:MAG: hypothetical protein RLZZ387_731, partial [Chloroflexota bacterium]
AAAQVARGRSRTSWRVALGLLLAAAGQALFTQPGCTLPAAALLFGGLVAATAALWPPVDVGVPRERPRLALADLLICTALAAVLLPVFLADLSGARTSHEDEPMWTTVGSGAFHTFFIERDLFGPFWREHYNTWGYYNPQVGKYLIGASLYAAGYQEKLDVSPEPIADVGLLAAARLPSALLGVASCLALYGVVTLVSDRRHGLLASGLMAGGSLLPLMSARAMVDAPALAFSMLGLLGTLLTLRALRAGQQRAFLLAATTGAACGLAAGVKLNGGLVFGVAVLALALEAVLALRSGRSPLAALACLGVAGAWAWAMFFATNPFLYPDPLGGVREMQKFNAFVGGFSLETPRIPQGKVRALWDSVSTYGPLGRAGLPGDQLLLLAGALRLALAARDPGEWWRRSWGPLALWVLVSYVMIGLWLPVDWDRYYLPLQPVNAALQALGVLWAADAALALARRPAAGRQPGESSVERAP